MTAFELLRDPDITPGDPGRSSPGEGDPVAIHLVNPKAIRKGWSGLDSGVQGPNIGEDYANSAWPIVVKVKKGVSQEDLVFGLEELLNHVRQRWDPWAPTPDPLF